MCCLPRRAVLEALSEAFARLLLEGLPKCESLTVSRNGEECGVCHPVTLVLWLLGIAGVAAVLLCSYYFVQLDRHKVTPMIAHE